MVQLESKQKFSSSTSLSHPVASKTATSSIPPTSESTPLAEISKTVNAKTIEPAGAFSNLIRSIEIPDSLASEQLLANRRFNTSEERKLYGTSEADGEDAKNGAVDPLMGFYALAIATGIVGASTGLGVWVTARLMGVDNVRLTPPLYSLSKVVFHDRRCETELSLIDNRWTISPNE